MTPAVAAVSDEGLATCRRVSAALPATLGERLSRRAVTGDPELTAAWGDPAVMLACGTSEQPLPTAELVRLGPSSGGTVTFAFDDVGPATAYTSQGLPVQVTVTVPDAYDATLLVPLTGVLLREDR